MAAHGPTAGILVAMAAVMSLAGCGIDGQSTGPGSRCATADFIVPSDSLQDLVTYADEVAVVEVVDDEVIEHDEPNDGLELERSRDVTIEVTDVVWTAPQKRNVPQAATFTTGGWRGDDPDKGPAPSCRQPALEVGHRYLVGMVEYSVGSWAPMSGPFVLEIDTSGVVQGAVDDGPVSRYDGATPAAVGAALADVVPDPAVAPYRDQPGGLRYRASIDGG